MQKGKVSVTLSLSVSQSGEYNICLCHSLLINLYLLHKSMNKKSDSIFSFKIKGKKIWKIGSILLFAFFSSSVFAQVTASIKKKTVKEAIRVIESQTDYRFFYSNQLPDLDKIVSVEVNNQSIDVAMNKLLGNTQLIYERKENNQIYLASKKAGEVARKVSGNVVDTKGEPIIGANVVVKGTTNGTVTDMGGAFSLNVTDGSTLLITYIGYTPQEVVFKGQRNLSIKLMEDMQTLEEVVAIGYGTMKRSDVIGSVASVSNKALEGRAMLNIDQALMGKAAGVSVTPKNGQPGKSPSVRIRGIGTFNNNDPLYIVDGVPINENGADIINAQDVESIEILKDAASAAIYGSRAGNGVILVTTKKGADAKPIVFYDMNLGLNQASQKLELLNASEFTTISDEALTNGGREPYWKGSTGRANTNWQDHIFQNGFVQSYSLGVRGGKKDIRYYLSAGYDDQDGTLYETGFKRYSLKSNIDVNVTERLLVGMNISYTRRESTDIEQGINSVLMNAVRMPPTVPAYNEDGTLGYPVGNEGDGQNPIGYAQRSRANSKSDRALINVFGEYKIIPSLVLRTNFSADINNYQYSQFRPTYVEGNGRNDIATLNESTSFTNSISWENTLTFNQKFGDEHNFTAMIGQSVITSDYKYTNASKKGFLSNDEDMRYFSAGTEQDLVNGNRTDWAQLSYFGRINYTWKNRYMAQLNVRSDGSSRFGKNNKWGTFPSGAIGWRISEENFMKDVQWISNLKLRASYGVLGTQPTDVYGFTSSLNQSKYIFGSNQDVVIGYFPGSKANDNFKWETTYQTNVGVDFGVLDNTLTFTMEYFDKYTKDILQVLPLPSYAGMGGTLTNIGEMKNTGFEITGQYNNHVNAFHYNIGCNFSTLNNTVKKLFDNDAPINGSYNRTEVGRSIGEFYGFVYDGIFQNQSEIDRHKAQPNAVPGDIRFKDRDNNGMINNDDMDYLGSPLPKVMYGINLGFEYKGLDFALFMQGVSGNKIYYSGRTYLINGGNNFNKSTDILDRWQKEGDITNVPRVSVTNSNDNFRRSSLFIESGSYLRINNVQLGYSLKNQWIRELGLSKARIYVSVNNLATFTKYSGYDPAVDISSIFSPGDDQITYPVPRTFLAGLSLTF